MMLVLAIVEIFSVILQRIFCDSTLKKKKIRRYTDYLVSVSYTHLTLPTICSV